MKIHFRKIIFQICKAGPQQVGIGLMKDTGQLCQIKTAAIALWFAGVFRLACGTVCEHVIT
jgi:hypothetical protein